MKPFITNLFLLPALIAGLGLIPAGRVTAQTFTTLYNFTNTGPSTPEAGLVLSGNTLYGTTYGGGGSFNKGAVFALNTNGTGFAVVHTFSGYPEGATPIAGLILSGSTLYGTTSSGGEFNAQHGTVFALNTGGSGFTTLHSLADNDGSEPYGALVLSGGILYGTAHRGGSPDTGTVFAVNPGGSLTVLHTFTANSSGTNSDGVYPAAGLVLSGSTLYGTASEGGSTGRGTVFAVNTGGSGFTNLHNFTAATNDGAFPVGGVILSGNTLYGTTTSGGSHGIGTIFAVHTDGSGFTLVHDFAGGDGSGPQAALILSGNTLYGTTYNGGNGGTVFAVNADGSGFKVLHTFITGEGGGSQGDLILSGNTLYGTTIFGGTSGAGTVFSLTLPPPQLAIVPAGANVVLTWPISPTGFTLQSTTNLVSPAVWSAVSPAPVVVNALNTVTNLVSGSQKFFRLSQ